MIFNQEYRKMNKSIFSIIIFLFGIYFSSQAQEFLPEQKNDGWEVNSDLNIPKSLVQLDSLIREDEFKLITSVSIAHKGELVFDKY